MNSAQATADLLTPRAAAREAAKTGTRSPFLPLLLMGLALLGWLAFETLTLTRDRAGLERMLATQEPQLAASMRLRTALSDLATDTQKLAEAGDPGAQLIVKQLRRHGITIHPGSAGPSSP